MNVLVDTLYKIGIDRGISFVISIVVIAALFVGLVNFNNNWKSQKSWERERATRRDDLEEKRVKESAELNKYLARVLASTDLSIKTYSSQLEEHSKTAEADFENIDKRFDKLDTQLDILKDHSETLATKEMVDEVGKNVKIIRESLKK
jgi:predicted nuclease with TOPRIM domain